SGKIVARFTPASPVHRIAASADGRRVAVAARPVNLSVDNANDPVAHVLDVDARGALREAFALDGDRSDVVGIAFSRDGRQIATETFLGSVRIFDGATGKLRLAPEGPLGWVQFPVFSADGKTLATSCWDGYAHVWDTASGTERQRVALLEDRAGWPGK